MGAIQNSMNQAIGSLTAGVAFGKHMQKQKEQLAEQEALRQEQQKLRELQGVRAHYSNINEQRELVKDINAETEAIEGHKLPDGSWQEGLESTAEEAGRNLAAETEYQRNLETNKRGRLVDPKTKKFLSEEKLNQKLQEMKKSFEEANYELEARRTQKQEFEERLALVRQEGKQINKYYGRNDQSIPTSDEELDAYIKRIQGGKR